MPDPSVVQKDLTGKPFERLVAAVQKKLDNDADIEWNARMRGASGTSRQVDVAIRGRWGSAKLFIAVEAKDYEDKVDIGIVESFIAKLKDIGANKGILVSSGGFTRDALLRARQDGVDTCVLRPATNDDWKNRIQYIDLRVAVRYVQFENATLVLMDGERIAIPFNGELALVYDDGVETTVQDVMAHILTKRTELEGLHSEIRIDSPAHYFRDDARRRQVKGLMGTFRHVEEEGIHTVTKVPEDWVFVQHLPDGVEDEKSFFVFKELEKLANDFKKA
ncbi:MAG TPA: restriction endonuclease [Polyangium sp.]|nr:restriction endonuclease [Polyangium sp.]